MLLVIAWCAAAFAPATKRSLLPAIQKKRTKKHVLLLHAVVPSSSEKEETTGVSQQDVGFELRDSVKLCFVGGKGGVGKTSISGAIATKLSDDGEKVLVVSTDPAHSLGDALGQALSRGAPSQVVEASPSLFAMEIDAEGALEKWRSAVAAFDVEGFASRYGRVAVDALRSLGIDEFLELVSNPPPGIDELVALSEVVKRRDDYDRIIVDTAPTGHALRLLDLPRFADAFVGNVLKLKSKLSQLANFAGDIVSSKELFEDVDKLADRLETLHASLGAVRSALRDQELTEFVVVAIPTLLASRETRRLATSLRSKQRVAARSIVVNRVIQRFDASKARTYAANQRALLDAALGTPPLSKAIATRVPFVADGELVGEHALRYFGGLAFGDWEDVKKLVIVGGKGGVGKTTAAASLAVFLSDGGRRVAAVSTDPAHSLGDAFDVDLPPGTITRVAPTLDALEIDADAAAREAAEVLKTSIGSDNEALAQLAQTLETPPPGVDELVSLLKVLDLARSRDYEYIVVDTAPTGHTLRMLALPEILDDFAERAANARDRLRANPFVRAFLKNQQQQQQIGDETVDRLRDLQEKALALDVVLHDKDRTEFVMVCAPNDLSISETARLKTALDDAGVQADRLVVNGLLDDDEPSLDAFAAKRRANQDAALDDIHQLSEASHFRITHIPQYDTDVSGVYGLRALAHALFRPR
ncbi:hypothetical protein CTAYLR_004318 [Chrysophaeum taylorii]|uniref:ArsA/GET3 Anion-transporting ATPase-like domain-containing protein n=1 Tax=Chrysophaeum taylorii TaxID=2483200 RepID=A0AAD7XLR0_9STRA|nr:hypothetical protein CTAYLR_004318 [Chrysophaeum taylorii]